MKEFLKIVLGSMLGFMIVFGLFIIIIFAIIASAASFGEDQPVFVKPNSILFMDLSKTIIERGNDNPFDNFDLAGFKSTKTLGLNQILAAIDKASSDDNIKGILLELSDIPAGYATIEPIRNHLIAFRKSGKFVYAFGDNFSQKAYYLATAADQIIVNPHGYIEFKGLYSELMFFKGALEKLDVETQVVRHGKFKSAVEPFTEDKMSDANRIQTELVLNSIWSNIIKEIASARVISIDSLNLIADSLWANHASQALRLRMIDKTMYKDELLILLKEKVGIALEDDLASIELSKYIKTLNKNQNGSGSDQIAVIYANGEISSGEGDEESIGADGLSQTIRKARQDSSIKAIVLRINSPGGDALASEIIWREVYLANTVKPVVVSMSDLAASGGYYIACPARVIYAEPSTITGSIGVFGIIPNLQKLFNEKLGITFDEVKTNEHSDYISVNKPLSDFDRMVLLNQIETIYATFIQRVSDGRKIPVNMVDSIGQGRIWSGIDARRIHLIDSIGGLGEAISGAAILAGINEYSIVELPVQKDPIEELLNELLGIESMNATLIEQLGEYYSVFTTIKSLSKWSGVQARLPFVMIIH